MSVRLAALLVLVTSATAFAKEVPEDISRLLERYEHAWESGNVFELLLLAPAESEVFESLLDDETLDHIVETAVEIRDVEVREHDGLGGALVVEFTKIQEDVRGLGTVTRGIARIELLVRPSAMMGPQILAHRVVPFPNASDGYRPGDVSTWDEDRPLAERNFHEAHGLLLKGDVAEARARLALVLREMEARPNEVLFPLATGAERFAAQVCYLAAVCELRLGDEARGESLLRAAVTHEPGFPLALNQLAERAAARGDLEGAVALWNRSLAVYAEQPEVRSRLDFHRKALQYYADADLRALFLGVRGLPPSKAAEKLSALARLSTDEPETRRRLAVAYLNARQPEKARLALNDNEYLHPGDLETTYLLARTYVALERLDDAAGLLARLWERSPGYRDTEILLAQIYAVQNRDADAEGVLREALASHPERPDLLYRLGLLALRRGATSEARDALQRATELRAPAELRRAIYEALLPL